jgi:hypothetical protein
MGRVKFAILKRENHNPCGYGFDFRSVGTQANQEVQHSEHHERTEGSGVVDDERSDVLSGDEHDISFS